MQRLSFSPSHVQRTLQAPLYHFITFQLFARGTTVYLRGCDHRSVSFGTIDSISQLLLHFEGKPGMYFYGGELARLRLRSQFS